MVGGVGEVVGPGVWCGWREVQSGGGPGVFSGGPGVWWCKGGGVSWCEGDAPVVVPGACVGDEVCGLWSGDGEGLVVAVGVNVFVLVSCFEGVVDEVHFEFAVVGLVEEFLKVSEFFVVIDCGYVVEV